MRGDNSLQFKRLSECDKIKKRVNLGRKASLDLAVGLCINGQSPIETFRRYLAIHISNSVEG